MFFLGGGVRGGRGGGAGGTLGNQRSGAVASGLPVCFQFNLPNGARGTRLEPMPARMPKEHILLISVTGWTSRQTSSVSSCMPGTRATEQSPGGVMGRLTRFWGNGKMLAGSRM